MKKTYKEALSQVREEHYRECIKRLADGYNNGTLNIANLAYVNGWNAVTGFVNKAIGPARLVTAGGKEDLAVELAQKLSDLFFEYRDKAVEIEKRKERSVCESNWQELLDETFDSKLSEERDV